MLFCGSFDRHTFQLTKVLKGIHTIVMESGDGFQVQGFIFKKPQRELSEICALDAESIYGDKFAREEDAVTGIGNRRKNAASPALCNLQKSAL